MFYAYLKTIIYDFVIYEYAKRKHYVGVEKALPILKETINKGCMAKFGSYVIHNEMLIDMYTMALLEVSTKVNYNIENLLICELNNRFENYMIEEIYNEGYWFEFSCEHCMFIHLSEIIGFQFDDCFYKTCNLDMNYKIDNDSCIGAYSEARTNLFFSKYSIAEAMFDIHSHKFGEETAATIFGNDEDLCFSKLSHFKAVLEELYDI